MSENKSVKVGDVVLYTAFGRTVNAIVKAVRHGESSHLGKNQEPILTIAFVDPARQLAIAPKKNVHVLLPETQIAQVYEEHDVVHASHEFDEEFLKKHGRSPAQIASQRGHGEWQHAFVGSAETPAELSAQAPAESDPVE